MGHRFYAIVELYREEKCVTQFLVWRKCACLLAESNIVKRDKTNKVLMGATV